MALAGLKPYTWPRKHRRNKMRSYLEIAAEGDGPTVDEVIEALSEISRQGMGESRVLVFDPNTEDWEFLAEIGYGGERSVMLFAKPE
jgi:hypothetical protein